MDSKHTALFAVFDGHGGGAVAKFSANHIASELVKLPSYADGNLSKAIMEAYYHIDELLDTKEGHAELHAIDNATYVSQTGKGLFSDLEDTLSADQSEAVENEEDQADGISDGNREKIEDVDSEKNNDLSKSKDIDGIQKHMHSSEEFLESALRRHSVIVNNESGGAIATETTIVEREVQVSVPSTAADAESIRQHKAGGTGCTAVAALIRGSTLIVANTGDSRCVLSRKGEAEPVTLDHKPILYEEAQRIIRAGGFVKDNRVNGALNVSRTLGDLDFKRNADLPHTEQMVIATPDVQEIPLEEGVEFLILACDGIWDVLSNQDAVDFVRKRLKHGHSLRSICEQMCDHCLAPDLKGLCRGADNMSVIIVLFKRQANLTSPMSRFWNACVGMVRKSEK